MALDAINKRGETLGEDTYGEVHSFCTNLHKTGVSLRVLSHLLAGWADCCAPLLQLVTFDCSTFFVRDSRLLTEVLDVTPPFLRNQSGYGAVTDYRNWGLSLGRRFRSLKILFMLRSFGVEGFQAHLRRTIELTQVMDRKMEQDVDFQLVTPRSLGLLVFRLAPNRMDSKKLDELNKRLYANIHKKTGIQLSAYQ